MIKAAAIAELPEVKAMDAIVLADDSGLEIDYLNKEPGIYSVRYAGTDTSYDIKNSLLLSRMKGYRISSVQQGLSVRWQQYFRTGTKRLSVERWKDVLVTKSPGKWIWLRSDLFPAGIRLYLGRACTGKEE